jgi:hypothetical protein
VITNITHFTNQGEQEAKVSPPCPEAIIEKTALPLSFLAYNLSEEIMSMILDQHIWSFIEITFTARPFQVVSPPLLLFCLQEFSTTNTNMVKATVYNAWTEDVALWDIIDILVESNITKEQAPAMAINFIKLLWVEHLDFKVSGGILLPHYNIFAISPTNNPSIWMKLRSTPSHTPPSSKVAASP